MIDFTPIVEALIGLAVTAITVFLIPWLKERYGNETLTKAQGWVSIGVMAAEKLYGAGNGKEKLAYRRCQGSNLYRNRLHRRLEVQKL